MSGDKITILKNTAAIDATILMKEEAFKGFAATHNIPFAQIAFIGDEALDECILTLPGLGLAGAPGNAQARVKEAVHKVGGVVLEGKVIDGFFEFYEIAKQKGITHIVSDKDGTLTLAGDYSRGPEFAERVASRMGHDNKPFVSVLTGSGISQNREFMQAYGLDERLAANEHVQAKPYLLLAESGALHVNVLTGEILNYCEQINPELLHALKGPFEQDVLRKLTAKLPAFGFTWSNEYHDQDAKVYVAPKLSMVTINVPREADGNKAFRKTPEAERFRDAIVETMMQTAEELELKYTIG